MDKEITTTESGTSSYTLLGSSGSSGLIFP